MNSPEGSITSGTDTKPWGIGRINAPTAHGCAGAAILIVVAANSASADTHEPMSEPLTIEGELTDEGVTCPALRGDIGELQPGQRVRVTSEVAEMSMCMQGTTIALGEITAPSPSWGEPAP